MTHPQICILTSANRCYFKNVTAFFTSMEHWAKGLFVRFWIEGLLAELQARMSRMSYQVSLIRYNAEMVEFLCIRDLLEIYFDDDGNADRYVRIIWHPWYTYSAGIAGMLLNLSWKEKEETYPPSIVGICDINEVALLTLDIQPTILTHKLAILRQGECVTLCNNKIPYSLLYSLCS